MSRYYNVEFPDRVHKMLKQAAIDSLDTDDKETMNTIVVKAVENEVERRKLEKIKG